MPLAPGQAAEVHQVVTRDLTADVLGNTGVTVFANPVRAHPVGTAVDMRHLAATPVGMTVRARAVLRETDGRRCLFDVEAWDEVEKIAEGRHERYVVASLDRFRARTAGKGGGAGRAS